MALSDFDYFMINGNNNEYIKLDMDAQKTTRIVSMNVYKTLTIEK